MKDKRFR